MSRSPLTGRPLAALLVAAAAVALLACGSSSAGDDRTAEDVVADARPVAGSPGAAPPAGGQGPPAASAAPDAHDHHHDSGQAHVHEEPGATVPSAEVCDLLAAAGCALLPDHLTEPQVELVTWAASSLPAGREAPDVVLGAAIVTCAFLDDVPYRDMVVLADRLNRTEADPSLALVYAMAPFVTPAAATFLCPEHLESARADMAEVVCATATPEVCAAFEADWLA
ncbi:MAG: hypothetical protein AAGA99_04920 [Actinomycetota bacterium]